jgi:two-component system chemotaxis response regulator CheY
MATFFIVDDDRLLHTYYRKMLEKMGHQIIDQAFDGRECIEKFTVLRDNNGCIPDYVIMDFRMPVKNGLEAMKELLKLEPTLRILFVSGQTSIKEKALSAGAMYFFEKPMEIEHLLDVVKPGDGFAANSRVAG